MVRDRIRQWGERRPALLAKLARFRVILAWALVVIAIIAIIAVPHFGKLVKVFASCLVVLVVWTLLVRTKTVSFAGTMRMFSAGAGWAVIIGIYTTLFAQWGGMTRGWDGVSIAMASTFEETGKLLPLIVLAIVAPGRVRRFGAGDWALLGFAAGLGFTAWEDGVRSMVHRPGLLSMLLNPDDSGITYGLNPWGSGQLHYQAAVAPGHHVWTANVAMAIGLAIVMWRTRHLWWRVGGVALVVFTAFSSMVDHASYNAMVADISLDPGQAHEGYPVFFAWFWKMTGQGHFGIWLSVGLFIACLAVDAWRRGRAGELVPTGPDRPVASGVTVTGHEFPRTLTGPAEQRKAVPAFVQAFVWLARMTISDIRVQVAAHSRALARNRRDAITRGQLGLLLVRNVRRDAMAVTTPGVEPAARKRFRWNAVLLGVGSSLALMLIGILMARGIGRYYNQTGDGIYLAGLLDGLARWWNGLGFGGQLLVGALIAGAVVFSGGSLLLGLGVSGAATWVFSHGHGLSALVTDPKAAVTSYFSTRTPLGMAWDAVEAILTFAPGNFAGGVAGQGARNIVRELWGNRQVLDDLGSAAAKHADDVATNIYKNSPWENIQVRKDWVADLYQDNAVTFNRTFKNGDPAWYQYQQRVTGSRSELHMTATNGTKIDADGLVVMPDGVVSVLETKHVANPASSPYTGTAFGPLTSNAKAQFVDELIRYRELIFDPNSPIQRITVVVNDPAGHTYLESIMRETLGSSCDWQILLAP